MAANYSHPHHLTYLRRLKADNSCKYVSRDVSTASGDIVRSSPSSPLSQPLAEELMRDTAFTAMMEADDADDACQEAAIGAHQTCLLAELEPLRPRVKAEFATQSFEEDLAATASYIARCEVEVTYNAAELMYLAAHRDKACQP